MNTCVVGLFWGDCGKGKITDILSNEHDYVIRYNGGANAGHTVCKDDEVFKLHHVPSGAVSDSRPFLVMTHGMVINPVTLWKEITDLQNSGIDITDRIMISSKAHCVMPWHIAADIKKGGKIGTTKKGIGPTYADKAHRWNAIRIGNLIEKLEDEKLKRFFAVDEAFHGEGLWQEYHDAAKNLASLIGDTGKLLRHAVAENKDLLLKVLMGYTLISISALFLIAHLQQSGQQRFRKVVGFLISILIGSSE